MITLLILFAFVVVVAASWFMGLWTNLITIVSMLLSGLVATNYFEPVATYFDRPVVVPSNGALEEFTYFLDFLSWWAIFIVCFAVLRAVTDMMSRVRVKFNFWVEIVGRSITALWIGGIFVCQFAFTLHLAPIEPNALQNTPDQNMFIGMAPDRAWMAFAQSRSRGALARGKFSTGETHPDDANLNVETFDPYSEFTYKYHHRKTVLEGFETLRVLRGEQATEQPE